MKFEAVVGGTMMEYKQLFSTIIVGFKSLRNKKKYIIENQKEFTNES